MKNLLSLSFGLTLLGCGGATRVTPLADTPLERGAHGPFTAALVTYPRAGLGDADVLARLEADRSDDAPPGGLADTFVADEARYGRITLFRDREAEAYVHDAAWAEARSRRHGAKPSVERFDVPVWIGQGPERGRVAPSAAEVALVKVKLPWFRPRGFVESRIVARVPEYQAIDSLAFKYFTLTDDGRVGGIYLWRDHASLASHYDARWHARVVARYGEDAEIRTYRVLAAPR